ncbi:MAG: phosphotransferase [Methylococcales bacterium]
MIPEDLRMLSMLDWLENDLLLSINTCVPASSDASFRRYFRISVAEQTFIVMDAPPSKENISAFIKVAELFKQAHVNVPDIYQQNLADGFLLLEDFGSQCFLDQLNADNAHNLYQTALDGLFTLQSNCGLAASNLPQYDQTLLQRELGVFTEWFLGQALDMEIPQPLWNSVCALLINSALAQPKTCVHRDYHSRNLMVLNPTSLGMIDFQDAVIGPITYDLVSLLRDCYVVRPQTQIKQLLSNHFQRLQQAGLLDCDLHQFTRWFDLMGLQRHLKVLGIFSRLHHRDGKSGYLKDIPTVLNYVTSVCTAYPELAEFNEFMVEQVQKNLAVSA